MVKDLEFETLRQRNSYIINQRQKGVLAQEIADELELSKRTIERVYSAYLDRRQVGRKKGSGRPKLLTTSLKIKIVRMINKNPQLTCKDISDRLNNVVCSEAIRLYLKSIDYANKLPSYIPNLSADDKENRVLFAEENMEIETERIFFTDECKFTLNGSTKVWGKKGKRINKTITSYPPKVMVWGAISGDGKVHLELITGSMNRFVYADMLEEQFIPVADDIMGEGEWTLQQDGASSHTANLIMDLLEEYEIETLDWPARSPDLNPIENIWGILKKRVYKRNPKTRMELEDFIFEEWENLDNEMVANTAMSFNSRLEQVIENDGEIIDY